MLPTNIQEVITELERIMTDCEGANNRLGYFAALYHKVTCRVRDGIAAHEFEDGPRMERFDVTFANRFIQAWQVYREGGTPTASWLYSFETAGKDLRLYCNTCCLA